MARLFRSKSCAVGRIALDTASLPHSPSSLYLSNHEFEYEEPEEEEEEEEEEDNYDYDNHHRNDYFGSSNSANPIMTPFINAEDRRRNNQTGNQFPVVAILLAALRKSVVVTCGVEARDVDVTSSSSSTTSASMDIGRPTDVRHVSHVTFDRFNGFLGLPVELQPEIPRKVPSASASVFGVSAKSMQCSYDQRGNSVPTILLMMQKRLYSEGGLQAEGIFRINAENGQEEYVRDQLNKGLVPRGLDVHCLAGLIKAWFRELPTGVLDSLTPEQVMHCNTEEECTKLIRLLPPTDTALLDWAISLMADVVQEEHHNKMNARNIAMVFAPNMTQMADPLTALIHAVQVMNLLKTLIMKTIRVREESGVTDRLLCADSPSNMGDPDSSNSNKVASREETFHSCVREGPGTANLLRSATLDRLESETEEKFWSFQSYSGEDCESISGRSSPVMSKKGTVDNGFRDGCENGEVEGILDRLNLRRGVRKLCRYPVFQFGKPVKKSAGLGIENTRGRGGEAFG